MASVLVPVEPVDARPRRSWIESAPCSRITAPRSLRSTSRISGRKLNVPNSVLVGSSIYVEKPLRIGEFVTTNREVLNSLPMTFFQVSPSSAIDDPDRRAETA